LPAVTARGRWAGTTDDQRIVIVFGVIALISVLTLMASSTTRAVLPWWLEIEVIWRALAISTVYTKTGFERSDSPLLRANGPDFGPFARECVSDLRHRHYAFTGDETFAARFKHNSNNRAQSAATTASPIAAVPTCWQPGVRISPVRKPCSSTFFTAASMRSACSALFNE